MSSVKQKGSKKARLTMARLAAVQCVYQWMQSDAKTQDILHYYNNHFTGLKLDEDEILPPDQELLSDLLQGVQNEFASIKDVVENHLTKKPEAKDAKKDVIILSCLYCGTYELMHHSDIDAPLIISEYLHIARSFYEDSEVKLVNGILDAVKKTLNR